MKSIFSDDYRKLINSLKIERLKKGLSQRELSEKIGHSQSYISKLEHGQIRIDLVQLKHITKVLGIDAKKFLD